MYRSLDLILEARLGKDAALYSWRKLAFLQKVLTERPARWLPAEFKNYDELLSTAGGSRGKTVGGRKPTAAIRTIGRGSRFNYLEMLHPIGRDGILKKAAEQIGASAIGDTFQSTGGFAASRPIGAFCGRIWGIGTNRFL